MSDSDNNQRPQIPKEIRRRVLVEAGHRCAIPTCRYIQVEVHHIVPWAKSNSHNYDNLIALCPNCHARADRGEIDRSSLRMYKSNLRFIHDKFSQIEIDILFQAATQPLEYPVLWPRFMRLVIKRLLDAGYVELQNNSPPGVTATTIIKGMDITPDRVVITEEGRTFFQSLSNVEL